jgi:adenylylsulfate kinase-like enzyme
MIYWLTGQPCAGKTVLGNMLKKYLENTKNDKDPNKRYKI